MRRKLVAAAAVAAGLGAAGWSLRPARGVGVTTACQWPAEDAMVSSVERPAIVESLLIQGRRELAAERAKGPTSGEQRRAECLALARQVEHDLGRIAQFADLDKTPYGAESAGLWRVTLRLPGLAPVELLYERDHVGGGWHRHGWWHNARLHLFAVLAPGAESRYCDSLAVALAYAEEEFKKEAERRPLPEGDRHNPIVLPPAPPLNLVPPVPLPDGDPGLPPL